MKKVEIFIFLLLVLSVSPVLAQVENADSTDKPLAFDIFNPEDSLGGRIFEKLVEFEKYGHFGSAEDKVVSKKFVERFIELFDSNVYLPEDMSDTNGVKAAISVQDYAKLAYRHGYFSYVLFIEKKDVFGYKLDTSEFYYTTVSLFKLFDDRAIIGEKYKHAVEYAVGLRFDKDGKNILITDVKLLEGAEHFKFILGKYGRHIYSPILVSNNLNSLVQEIPPPYVPTPKPTKSNIFIRVGNQYTDIFYPESLKGNLDPNYVYSGSEAGYSVGMFYQKAFAKKDIFGIFLGFEFEQNSYEFRHENAQFTYIEDENGDPLVDLDGNEYDYKHVYLQAHVEKGDLNYLRPEVGLFLNLGKKVVNFQILGSIGNAFLMNSSYQSNSIVSYEGEKIGVGIIDEPALGFYQDLPVIVNGSHTDVQSFMFYKAGFGVDFILGERVGLSVLAEYKGSLTYIVRSNSGELSFLDPDSGSGFGSQLNMLNASRSYKGFALQAGIKFYLNEKR